MFILPKNNLKKTKYVLSAFGILFLGSCSTYVDRGLTAKNIAKELNKPDQVYSGESVKNKNSEKAFKIKYPKIDIKSILGNKTILDRLFTVNVKNVPVKSFIYSLAKDGGLQLDLHPIKNRRITLILNKVPLRYILDRVAEQADLVYSVKNNILTIRQDVPHWHSYRIDYVNTTQKSKGQISLNMSIGSGAVGDGNQTGASSGNTSDISVEAVNDFWKQVENGLKNITGDTNDNKKVIVNRESGIVSVFGNSKLQHAVSKYIDTISSRSLKQVLIEATVVEVELNHAFSAGIDWSKLQVTNGTPSQLSTAYPFHIVSDPIKNTISNKFNFDFGINFLQQFGKTKVLSSPKIMAINNQTAILKVVDNKVYFTIDVQSNTNANTTTTTYSTTVHTVPVGFMMTLTPFVGDDGEVTLYVRPTLSRILGYQDDPNPALASAGVVSKIPIVQEREISSTLKLKDGQVAILGGLMQSQKSGDDSSLPGVGDIPGVGELFHNYSTSNKKTELVIFLRPKIITKNNSSIGDQMYKSKLLY